MGEIVLTRVDERLKMCIRDRAYLENRPAENAGVFHKGDCPTCAFDDWCHL